MKSKSRKNRGAKVRELIVLKQPNNGSASKKSTKDLMNVIEGGSKIDQYFSPCEYSFPCTIDNLACVRKGTYCETLGD